MTRIERIETIRLGEHPRTLWVQLYTDDGLVGLGETYYVPGAVAAVIHDIAAPHLLGQSPFDLERAWTTLFQETNFYGYAGAEMRAISALDIALWDIVGQACGQPIYNLLGGRVRDRIRTYNTCASYGDIRDYEDFHERPDQLAESLLAEGITAMKIISKFAMATSVFRPHLASARGYARRYASGPMSTCRARPCPDDHTAAAGVAAASG